MKRKSRNHTLEVSVAGGLQAASTFSLRPPVAAVILKFHAVLSEIF
jgi:hypothetical protein